MKLTIFVVLLLNLGDIFAIEPIVIVHGGAGSVAISRHPGKYRGTKYAAQVGYKVLKETGSVLDAVEEAVKTMELDDEFNAGYGAVLTRDGEVQMDAIIMDGRTRDIGAVTAVQDIFHPITLARRVMEKTPYNFLGHNGAMKLAQAEGFKFLKPGTLVTQYSRDGLARWLANQGLNATGKQDIGEGNTVGAVAIDEFGNIAAATSTGGITGKMNSRIGDAPIPGAGTYSDNNLAGLSATGDGETIMKAVLVFDILKRMEYLGEDLQTAAEFCCQQMTENFGGDGGVIAIDKEGNVGIAFSSNQMSWAYQKGNIVYYGINPGEVLEHIVEAP